MFAEIKLSSNKISMSIGYLSNERLFDSSCQSFRNVISFESDQIKNTQVETFAGLFDVFSVKYVILHTDHNPDIVQLSSIISAIKRTSSVPIILNSYSQRYNPNEGVNQLKVDGFINIAGNVMLCVR